MLHFCEQNLTGLIAQPSNATSGLIYLIVGLFIIKKSKSLGLATIFLSITTIFFHATNSLVWQNLDFLSMFILLVIFIYKSFPLKKINKRFALIGLSLFITAFIFWIGDISKILCIPENHILTGHAIWHILTASGIWFFYKSLQK